MSFSIEPIFAFIQASLARDIVVALLNPLYYPFDPSRRIFLGFIIIALLMAYIIYQPVTYKKNPRDFFKHFFSAKIWLHASSKLDFKLMFANAGIKAVFITPWVVAKLMIIVTVSSGLRHQFGPIETIWLPYSLLVMSFTVVVFLAEDLNRFALHLCYHRIPFLWEFHKVHHSAEVLTPITLYRSHPVEMFLSKWGSVLIIGAVTGIFVFFFPGQLSALEILGVDVLGFTFNALGANLRHSHMPFSFGRLDPWLISPHMHQVHHSRRVEHWDKNFGSCFTLWDKLCGTLYIPKHNELLQFGCAKGGKHTVLSQWFSPFIRLCKKNSKHTQQSSVILEKSYDI